jgi:uncharacterized protein YgiM (DUF1202 family)
MRKYISIFVALLLIVNTAYAQESADELWQTGSNGLEYNCDTFAGVSTAITAKDDQAIIVLGDEVIARLDNGDEISVNNFISSTVMSSFLQDNDAAITANDLFNVITTACNSDASVEETSTAASVDAFPVVVNGDVNLRSCAGTNCDVVQIASNGSLLTVIAVDGDWYEVQLEGGGTAFIASRLTNPGPDAVISVDESYVDLQTGCVIAFDMKRGDMDINLIITGDNSGDLIADLYRPNEVNPLRVEGQLDKTFIDTGETYVHQYYRYNVSWPNGVYQLEITLNGETSKLAWELETSGDYNIFIYC